MTAHIQTRAQRDLKRAVQLIEEFGQRESDQAARDNFTRRAKDFPALVMQVGLAQALAFSAEKAKLKEKAEKRGSKERAHLELLWQVAQILNQPNMDEYKVLDFVASAPASEYMHLTRRVLGAWNYHRRFAVTILGEPKGNEDKE